MAPHSQAVQHLERTLLVRFVQIITICFGIFHWTGTKLLSTASTAAELAMATRTLYCSILGSPSAEVWLGLHWWRAPRRLRPLLPRRRRPALHRWRTPRRLRPRLQWRRRRLALHLGDCCFDCCSHVLHRHRWLLVLVHVTACCRDAALT